MRTAVYYVLLALYASSGKAQSAQIVLPIYHAVSDARVFISPNDSLIISIADDLVSFFPEVTIWDAINQKFIAAFFSPDPLATNCAFSPNSNYLFIYDDSQVVCYDLRQLKIAWSSKVQFCGSTSNGLVAVKQKLIESDHDQLLDINTGKETRHTYPYSNMVFQHISASGRYVIATNGDKADSLIIFDIEKEKQWSFSLPDNGMLSTIQLSPDGKTTVAAFTDSTLVCFDITSNKLHYQQKLSHPIKALGFSRNGNYFHSIGPNRNGISEKRVVVWDARSGKQILDLNREDEIRRIVFDPSEKQIMVTDTTTTMYDLPSGKQSNSFLKEGIKITGAAFSNRGNFFVDIRPFHTPCITNMQTGKKNELFALTPVSVKATFSDKSHFHLWSDPLWGLSLTDAELYLRDVFPAIRKWSVAQGPAPAFRLTNKSVCLFDLIANLNGKTYVTIKNDEEVAVRKLDNNNLINRTTISEISSRCNYYTSPDGSLFSWETPHWTQSTGAQSLLKIRNQKGTIIWKQNFPGELDIIGISKDNLHIAFAIIRDTGNYKLKYSVEIWNIRTHQQESDIPAPNNESWYNIVKEKNSFFGNAGNKLFYFVPDPVSKKLQKFTFGSSSPNFSIPPYVQGHDTLQQILQTISPAGNYFITSVGNWKFVWRTADGKALDTIKLLSDCPIQFLPDEQALAAELVNGSLTLVKWKPQTGKHDYEFLNIGAQTLPNDLTTSLAISPDGKKAVVSTFSRINTLVDIPKMKVLYSVLLTGAKEFIVFDPYCNYHSSRQQALPEIHCIYSDYPLKRYSMKKHQVRNLYTILNQVSKNTKTLCN